MRLFSFDHLETLASSYVDLGAEPTWFHLDADHTADCWQVSVQGITLPVRLEALRDASIEFANMLDLDIEAAEPIPLPCLPTTTLWHTLALLRFMHDPNSLTEENIRYLLLHGSLCEVLKLADFLNCPEILSKCKKLTRNLLAAQPSVKDISGFQEDPLPAPAGLVPFQIIRHLWDLAQSPLSLNNDHGLKEACYDYVAARCNAITNRFQDPLIIEEYLSFISDVDDYTELLGLRHAFDLCMEMKKPKYCGRTIRKILGQNNRIPVAPLKFKIYDKEGGDGGDGCGDKASSFINPVSDYSKSAGKGYINQRLTLHGTTYIPQITFQDGKMVFCLHMALKSFEEADVEIYLRLLHPTDPSRSISLSYHHRCPGTTNSFSPGLISDEGILEFVDKDTGLLKIHIEKVEGMYQTLGAMLLA